VTRIAQNSKRLVAQGRLDKARRLLSARYGFGVDGIQRTDTIRTTGPGGSVSALSINLTRPLLENVLSLIAGQRPGIKPIATNTDSTSTAQARLADDLRGYYERIFDLPNLEVDVVRGGLSASSWWLIQSWKPTSGAPLTVDPDTGRLSYEGDVELVSLPFWRVACDPVARRETQRQWVCFRTPANRYDLAVDYPLCAQNLLQGVTGNEDWGKRLGELDAVRNLDSLFGDVIDSEDAVWVWELRHLQTPALPEGRLVRFIDSDTILFDSMMLPPVEGENAPRRSKYPYKQLHALEWAPERVVGTANGHTSGFDLLALQELADVCTSSMATTLNMLGTPHLWVGPGTEGTRAPTYPLGQSGVMALEGPVAPQLVDFAALKPEVVQALGVVREAARESVSINNVVAGQPDKGMPAQAMALMRAQAVQFHSTAQGEYVRLVERNVTGVLQLLKAFARTKRVAEIAGKSGAWLTKEWSAEDVAGVERFACEPINPMTLSYESRVALADTMSKMGWIDREGFMSIYSSGQLKEALDSTTSARDLISANKDLLRSGVGLPPVDMAATGAAQQEAIAAGLDPADVAPVFMDDGKPHVRLLKTDPHWLAYNEYKAVLDSPTSRENAEIVAAVAGVLQETLRLWASLTPDELVAAKGPPLPSQAPPPMMPPEGGPPSESDGDLEPTKPNGPSLPKPPPDPLTGAQQGPESLGGLNG
jgi:hypothetical protein